MSIQKIILNYVRYNRWANEKLTGWLKSLDRELLYKQTPSSFPSVERTIHHMEQSQQFWLEIIGKKQLLLPEGIDTVESGLNLLMAGAQLMVDTFGAYTEEELLEQIPSTDMVQSRYEFILHVINHNSYHRGQIVAMCRQLGVVENIAAMDYEVFLWSSREI